VVTMQTASTSFEVNKHVVSNQPNGMNADCPTLLTSDQPRGGDVAGYLVQPPPSNPHPPRSKKAVSSSKCIVVPDLQKVPIIEEGFGAQGGGDDVEDGMLEAVPSIVQHPEVRKAVDAMLETQQVDEVASAMELPVIDVRLYQSIRQNEVDELLVHILQDATKKNHD